MCKKFHRHRYKIIGIGFRPECIEVDLVCKCGKHGTVAVDKYFEEKVLNQAAKGKYLRTPIKGLYV